MVAHILKLPHIVQRQRSLVRQAWQQLPADLGAAPTEDGTVDDLLRRLGKDAATSSPVALAAAIRRLIECTPDMSTLQAVRSTESTPATAPDLDGLLARFRGVFGRCMTVHELRKQEQ
jgi:hypothetical protein